MKFSALGIIFAFASLLIVGACSKNSPVDEHNPGKEDDGGKQENNTGKVSGFIYYNQSAEGVKKFDLKTQEVTDYLPYRSDRNGWDISWDGEWLVEFRTAGYPSDDVQINIMQVSDKSVLRTLYYTPINGGFPVHSGKISHDKKWIVFDASREEGFVVFDLETEEVVHLSGIDGEDIDRSEEVVWLPDNSLLFTHKNLIYKSAPPYDNATKVAELDGVSWGHLAVNKQGTKMAVYVQDHIVMLDIEGKNPVQVTNSENEEVYPVFSPDGNHLVVGTDYFKSSSFSGGASWRLKIIPADGQTYYVDPYRENSPQVISIMEKGASVLQAANGTVLWR